MTRDSQGVEIKVGQKVAYNLSGCVVPGEIVEVRPQVRVSQWSVKDDIRIETSEGHISRVRNGDSVLVLP